MQNSLSNFFGGENIAPAPAGDEFGAGKSGGKAPDEVNAPCLGAASDQRNLQLVDRLADWNPGQELLDDFVVERTLGEGGMGKVYLVRSHSSGSRFAVKRAKELKETDRRAFLAELQTWIDLPEHDNLLPCRFFRTVGNEVLIFADYVAGGSLQDWVDSRKLYDDGPQRALERMIDIAIQSAWGLHCLHQLGLVHQDVKPGNIMICAATGSAVQGVKPQVTDYGLARARAASGEAMGTVPSHGPLVSSGGGTRAFWSPEQAMGMKLNHSTDIWSWGVSVLELFTGEVTWSSGSGAAAVLDQYLHQYEPESRIPAMPCTVVDVLRQCFRAEPSQRPPSFGRVVEELQASYRNTMGVDYVRTLAPIKRQPMLHDGIGDRRRVWSGNWTDPREWLEKALRAAGHDPAEAATIAARRGVTRRGELVADLIVYDEAKRLYERLVREGQKELEEAFSMLCMEKAMVHRCAADDQGALHEYDQVIAIRKRLVEQEGRRDLAPLLATVYLNKALAVSAQGGKRGAVALYDQGIAVLKCMVDQEGRRELANLLAKAYQNKADVISDLGDYSGAMALCDLALALLERLVSQDGRRELANDLARVYITKAHAVGALGDNREAVALYDKGTAIWEPLVDQEGRRELTDDLAKVYAQKAVAVRNLGDNRGAVALYDQALALLECLVNQEDRRELADDLARVYMNKANAVRAQGNNRGAVAFYDQALALLERLVNQEGRRELANDFATGFMNKANAVRDFGDYRGAVALYEQAIAIRERLVNQEGRRELANELAGDYMNKAAAVKDLGDKRAAVALYEQAIAIRESLVNNEGRRDLLGDLAWIKANRAEALITLGQRTKGLQELRTAQGVLEEEIARTDRADLKAVLAWLHQQLLTYSTSPPHEHVAFPMQDMPMHVDVRMPLDDAEQSLLSECSEALECSIVEVDVKFADGTLIKNVKINDGSMLIPKQCSEKVIEWIAIPLEQGERVEDRKMGYAAKSNRTDNAIVLGNTMLSWMRRKS